MLTSFTPSLCFDFSLFYGRYILIKCALVSSEIQNLVSIKPSYKPKASYNERSDTNLTRYEFNDDYKFITTLNHSELK